MILDRFQLSLLGLVVMLYQIVMDLLSLFYKMYELFTEKLKGGKKENTTDSSSITAIW